MIDGKHKCDGYKEPETVGARITKYNLLYSKLQISFCAICYINAIKRLRYLLRPVKLIVQLRTKKQLRIKMLVLLQQSNLVLITPIVIYAGLRERYNALMPLSVWRRNICADNCFFSNICCSHSIFETLIEFYSCSGNTLKISFANNFSSVYILTL